MDSNNWRQPSQTEQPPMDGACGDWRSQLQADSRQRVVNKIMDTLRHHLPSSGHEGVRELNKLATRFEENAYHAATNQFDYLRRISLKMLTMESKSNPPDPMLNAMPSNSAGMSRNSQDPAGSQSMQPQVQNQGQSHSIPTASNQPTSATALQPHVQQQTQQNNLLSSAQLQSSHRFVMQKSSVMQPLMVSGLQQNQPSSIQQSSQSSLQQHQQSYLPSMHQQQLNSQTLVVGTLPQQQQMLGSQSAFLDSTAQTGNSDTQKEVYQKIKVMKDLYFAGIHDIYQKICSKLQQLESLSQQAKPEGFERLKIYKQMIERILHFLQISESNAHCFHKHKLASLEKQILNILNTHRPSRKPGPPLQQGQIPPSHMQSLQKSQQPHSQIPQNQSHENGVNSQLQSVNVQGSSVPTMQPGDMSGSSLSGITSSQPNMNTLQPGSNLESGQGNAVGSIQQNPVSAPQQANPQTGVNLLHSSMNSLQQNSNMLQSQHLKQQQEQQLKQVFQNSRINQQLLHNQQQQLQQQQQLGKMQGRQMPQLRQMNDVNDIKLRQSMVLNSSPLVLQGSPQINQHSSMQIDQQNLLPPITKFGTSLQYKSSLFVPTMFPLAPSSMPGDPEKASSAMSNAANITQQQTLNTPASLDSTAQTGNSDTQEEVYQKIKVMKELYFAEVHDIYQKICSKLQQHESLSQQARPEGFERLKIYKQMIERILHCLQISESNVHRFHKYKLASLEKQILNILNTHRPSRKPGPPLQQGQTASLADSSKPVT